MTMTRSALLAIAMLSSTSLATAQDAAVSIGVAYQHLTADDVDVPLGLGFDVAVSMRRGIALVAAADWSSHAAQQFGLREVTTELAAGGGLRASALTDRRLGVFVQLLVGLARQRIDIDRFGADSTVSALVQPGIGITFHIGRRAALAGEIDWRAVPRLSERPHWWRIAAGVRLAVR